MLFAKSWHCAIISCILHGANHNFSLPYTLLAHGNFTAKPKPLYSNPPPKGKIMPTKSNTAKPAAKIVCTTCGKTITKAATLKSGVGSRCQHMQTVLPATKMQAHYKRISVTTMPKGYVKVATFTGLVKSNAHNIAGLTVAKVVKAIGTDRATGPLANPICQPYYLPNRHRVVHGWLATQAGLQAIATGNFSGAPTPPKVATI